MRVRRGLALAAVVVGLDVLPAAAATSAAAPALLPWAAPAALAVLFVVAMTAHRRRRASIVPTYTPPTTLRAGEAGVVIDGRVDGADVIAAVADLGVRGYLALEPVRTLREEDVVVSVARPWHHDPDIRPFEAVMLAHVFADGGTPVRLSTLRDGSDASRTIRENLAADLVDRAVFITSPAVLARIGPWAALLVFAAWAQLAWNAGSAWPTFAAGGVTAVLVWMLAALLSGDGLTEKGRRARQELLGFREFLDRADKDRLERLEPGTLDPNLPWAIALGVTVGWLRIRIES